MKASEAMKDASSMMLGTRKMEDGTWRAVLSIYYDDKAPVHRMSPQVFATPKEAKLWIEKEVVPSIREVHDTIAIPLPDSELFDEDPDKPEGMVCTAYQVIDGKRAYCGKPAVFVAPEIEQNTCQEHYDDYTGKFPEHKSKWNRIN